MWFIFLHLSSHLMRCVGFSRGIYNKRINNNKSGYQNRKNKTDKNQNRQIAKLQQQLAIARSNRPRVQQRAVTRSQRPVQPAIGGSLAKPGSDPILMSIKAKMDPFSAPKGIASPLWHTSPSQKFMAKANTSVTVNAGCRMLFMCAPCIASDPECNSVVIGLQTNSNNDLSAYWESGINGDEVIGSSSAGGATQTSGGTISTMNTSTPYSFDTLSQGDYSWALVGSGLRFTYEGAELYRNGTFKYVHDVGLHYSTDGSGTIEAWNTRTPGGMIDFVDSAVNNIRQSINANNIVEINTFLDTGKTSSGNNVTGWSQLEPSFIGGTTATQRFGQAPTCLGYYINTGTSAVQFHIEAVEHWIVTGRQIQSLQTETFAHDMLAVHTNAVLNNARQAHATKPNTHHTSILKQSMKVAASPVGHEVLNAALMAALA